MHSSNTSKTIYDLPADALIQVMFFCMFEDILALSQTAKLFRNEIVSKPIIWIKLLYFYFPCTKTLKKVYPEIKDEVKFYRESFNKALNTSLSTTFYTATMFAPNQKYLLELFCFAKSGNLKKFKESVEKKIDNHLISEIIIKIHEDDDQNRTPLYFVARHKHQHILDYLYVVAINETYFIAPIILRLRYNQINLIKSEVNYQETISKNISHIIKLGLLTEIIRYGYYELTKIVLGSLGSYNDADAVLIKSFDEAVRYQHLDIADFILSNFPKVKNLVTHDHLYYSPATNNDKEMINFLFENKFIHTDYPVICAINSNSIDALIVLLEHGLQLPKDKYLLSKMPVETIIQLHLRNLIPPHVYEVDAFDISLTKILCPHLKPVSLVEFFDDLWLGRFRAIIERDVDPTIKHLTKTLSNNMTINITYSTEQIIILSKDFQKCKNKIELDEIMREIQNLDEIKNHLPGFLNEENQENLRIAGENCDIYATHETALFQYLKTTIDSIPSNTPLKAKVIKLYLALSDHFTTKGIRKNFDIADFLKKIELIQDEDFDLKSYEQLRSYLPNSSDIKMINDFIRSESAKEIYSKQLATLTEEYHYQKYYVKNRM